MHRHLSTLNPQTLKERLDQSQGMGVCVLGDPGAASWHDTIFSKDEIFLDVTLLEEPESPLGPRYYRTSSRSVSIDLFYQYGCHFESHCFKYYYGML